MPDQQPGPDNVVVGSSAAATAGNSTAASTLDRSGGLDGSDQMSVSQSSQLRPSVRFLDHLPVGLPLQSTAAASSQIDLLDDVENDDVENELETCSCDDDGISHGGDTCGAETEDDIEQLKSKVRPLICQFFYVEFSTR